MKVAVFTITTGARIFDLVNEVSPARLRRIQQAQRFDLRPHGIAEILPVLLRQASNLCQKSILAHRSSVRYG